MLLTGVPVAQWVRASDWYSEGHGFNPQLGSDYFNNATQTPLPTTASFPVSIASYFFFCTLENTTGSRDWERGYIHTHFAIHTVYTHSYRVLSRIFGLGGKMLKVIVDGGCRHRPQSSRGVWGHAPQNFEPSESGSEAF